MHKFKGSSNPYHVKIPAAPEEFRKLEDVVKYISDNLLPHKKVRQLVEAQQGVKGVKRVRPLKLEADQWHLGGSVGPDREDL